MPVELLLAWLMISLRATGFLLLLPGLTGLAMPIPVRMAMALAVATLLFGLVPHAPVVPATTLDLIWTGAGEVGLGLLLGFVGRMAFFAIEFAGRIITQEIGMLPAPGIDQGAPSEPLPGFLHRFAVVLYFAVGGHLLALAAFARSFRFAPAGLPDVVFGADETLIVATGRVISAGVQLAAPFIALNFILTLAFGLLGRTVSKINVFVLSFPARSLGGLLLMTGAGVLFARFLIGSFERLPEQILELAPPLR
jgi:flagellar biosynthetic protein FliR